MEAPAVVNKPTKFQKLRKRVWHDRQLILIGLPGAICLFIFAYIPMFGIVTAFQDYSFRKGILGSKWVGVKYFQQFFSSMFFVRVVRNTLALSVLSLVFGMIFTIVFALMLNEVKDGLMKRFVQTCSYLPHFVSTVVVVGLMAVMLEPKSGIVNLTLQRIFNIAPIQFFDNQNWFRPLYVVSGLWQDIGWGSIIYLGAISAIDPQLYEAAIMDGCSRMKKIWYIVLPCIQPVIMTLLLLSIGGLLNVGYQKILLMYSPGIYETSDVISTYVYRRGIGSAEFGFGSAVGLFNSVFNLFLLFVANYGSKKLTEEYLF